MVQIQAHGREDRFVKCRALLDTCATANFISEDFVRQLDVPITTYTSSVGTINGISTESKGIVQITIRSIRDGFCKSLTCLTIPTIADLIPAERFPRESIKIPPNIGLADPEFHLPRPVDLLIGSGATLALFSIGQINLSCRDREVYLQKTRLGWVVAGGSLLVSSRKAICGLTNLEDQLVKFWDMEEIETNKLTSPEETECKMHFKNTVSRNNKGRYIVRLPFRASEIRLGDSRSVALKRLNLLERKFHANANLKQEYTRVLDEYLRLNCISLVENPTEEGYYMPHHAVIKDSSSTTKVRVVFDASARTNNGVSLNDMLLVGPTIQNKLFSHLIRFRTYKYVITADIEKMYLQVLVHEYDRHYQRILWRRNDKIETFQFNTLAFGIASSPFFAIRAIKKLADDERHAHPKAAEIIENHLYVDDLLTGANTIDEARTIRDEIILLLSRGGFTIRQWAANDEQIVNDLESNALRANLTFDTSCSLKTLGISWNTQDDTIRYSARPIKIAEGLTKRNILSEIAKIFDPLGLLGPIILYAKKLMQDIWRCRLHWDESVPQGIYSEWLNFTQQLELVNQISFNRKLLIDDCQTVQIHGFCDASTYGYGACLYIRSSDEDRNTSVRLLCAKSRVAPLKVVTIPRLELCGALLLARLYCEINDALSVGSTETVLWCDSTIVLHWIKTAPHLLKTYAANRVLEIQERTRSTKWRHVKSEDNPADALPRGQLPRAFSQNHTWHAGPSWLSKNETEWPSEVPQIIDIPELRKNVCLATTHHEVEIFEKYSSYVKLIRIIAYCIRFRHHKKYTGSLCAQEIIGAETRISRIVQAKGFPSELKALKINKATNTSTIDNLNPFLDEKELIRVGGRLQNSKLTFSQRHPILLPRRHHLIDVIIRETHEKHFHAGVQTTLCHTTEILVDQWSKPCA